MTYHSGFILDILWQVALEIEEFAGDRAVRGETVESNPSDVKVAEECQLGWTLAVLMLSSAGEQRSPACR